MARNMYDVSAPIGLRERVSDTIDLNVERMINAAIRRELRHRLGDVIGDLVRAGLEERGLV